MSRPPQIIPSLCLIALTSVTTLSIAHAQSEPPPKAPTSCPPGTVLVDPAKSTPQSNAGQTQVNIPQAPVEKKEYELDVHLLVPIFLSDIRIDSPAYRDPTTQSIVPVSIDPGLGVALRLAKDLGRGFNLGGMFQFMANRVDDAGSGRVTVGHAYFGASMRYAFINSTVFTPFVGADAGVNLWFLSFPDDRPAETQHTKPALGLTAVAGAAYGLADEFALEFGMRLSYTFQGALFGRGFAWLSPFVGGAFYW